VGGLLGPVLGGLGRGVGNLGTDMAMSFAATCALGQLAVLCYGRGRQMCTALLLPIQQQARTLDAGKVLEIVRKPMA